MRLTGIFTTLTISITMTISQEALTIYIFQPMLARPIGMIKTKTSLEVISKNHIAYIHVWKLTQAH